MSQTRQTPEDLLSGVVTCPFNVRAGEGGEEKRRGKESTEETRGEESMEEKRRLVKGREKYEGETVYTLPDKKQG